MHYTKFTNHTSITDKHKAELRESWTYWMEFDFNFAVYWEQQGMMEEANMSLQWAIDWQTCIETLL